MIPYWSGLDRDWALLATEAFDITSVVDRHAIQHAKYAKIRSKLRGIVLNKLIAAKSSWMRVASSTTSPMDSLSRYSVKYAQPRNAASNSQSASLVYSIRWRTKGSTKPQAIPIMTVTRTLATRTMESGKFFCSKMATIHHYPQRHKTNIWQR